MLFGAYIFITVASYSVLSFIIEKCLLISCNFSSPHFCMFEKLMVGIIVGNSWKIFRYSLFCSFNFSEGLKNFQIEKLECGKAAMWKPLRVHVQHMWILVVWAMWEKVNSFSLKRPGFKSWVTKGPSVAPEPQLLP
jgi:hypothetical protein